MDSQPKYENVCITDLQDHEEALSATEVDESLMGEEKRWNRQRTSKMETCMAVFISYRWILDVTLLLIIVGLLLLLRHEWSQHERPSTSWQVGGDYSGDAPICMLSLRQTAKFWTHDSQSIQRPSNSTQIKDSRQ